MRPLQGHGPLNWRLAFVPCSVGKQLLNALIVPNNPPGAWLSVLCCISCYVACDVRMLLGHEARMH